MGKLTAWRSPVADETHVSFIVKDGEVTVAFTVDTWERTGTAGDWHRQVINWQQDPHLDLRAVDDAIDALIASEQARAWPRPARQCPCGGRDFDEEGQCRLCTVASF